MKACSNVCCVESSDVVDDFVSYAFGINVDTNIVVDNRDCQGRRIDSVGSTFTLIRHSFMFAVKLS